MHGVLCMIYHKKSYDFRHIKACIAMIFDNLWISSADTEIDLSRM